MSWKNHMNRKLAQPSAERPGKLLRVHASAAGTIVTTRT